MRVKIFKFLPLYIGVLALMLGPITPRVHAEIIFSDSFSSSHNVLLDGHLSEIGAGWTLLAKKGANNTELAVNPKQSVLRRFGNQQMKRSGVIYTADVISGYSSPDYVTSVVQVRGDTNNDTCILAVRVQDQQNYYAVRWNEEFIQMYKMTRGVVYKLGKRFGSNGPLGGVENGSTVSLKVSGNTLQFMDDGVVLHEVQDDDHAKAGLAAIGMGAVIVPEDDISSQRLDTFTINTL